MENRFIRAEDVAQELNVSKPYASLNTLYFHILIGSH